MATFDELVADALSAPFSGWDFSWLAARSTAGTLPWSYQGEVARRAAVADAMLDLGQAAASGWPGFPRGRGGRSPPRRGRPMPALPPPGSARWVSR